VDPVADPLLLRKSGSAGNRTLASGSVARNSDHWTTEEVEDMQVAVGIIGQLSRLVGRCRNGTLEWKDG
jgi:hypothetical protein